VTDFKPLLLGRANSAGLPVSERLLAKLDQYYSLLVRWNQRVNLTGFNLVSPTPAAIDRLFLEPLAASRFLPLESESFIDIGSGGGSPAIPLALSRDGLRCVMVESRTRKSVFLVEVARALGIAAEVLTMRYEDVARNPLQSGRYDVVTMRAVRLDTTVLSALSNLLRPSGIMLIFRSERDDIATGLEELKPEVHPLPGQSNNRLLVLRKL
jgi:16S rRNA (guanine527-N7)-methyltransferase